MLEVAAGKTRAYPSLGCHGKLNVLRKLHNRLCKWDIATLTVCAMLPNIMQTARLASFVYPGKTSGTGSD